MLNQTLGLVSEPNISLTPVRVAEGNPPVAIRVLTSQLITYNQQNGFTRLRLTGRRVLEVKESTDEIDRLVRSATDNPAQQ
jgi:hypothetical protein